MGFHGVGVWGGRRQLEILFVLAACIGHLPFSREARCETQMTVGVARRQLNGPFEYRNRRGIVARLLQSRGKVALRRRVRWV
jgi:hypothetical protein